jgi:hypothetical protein
VACAVGVAIIPMDAEAKKPNCEKFKPDRTAATEKASATGVAGGNLAGEGAANLEKSTSSSVTELSEDQITEMTKVYNACNAFREGLIDEATWLASYRAYVGIDAPPPAAEPAPAPATPAPTQQPAAATSPAPVVVIQQPQPTTTPAAASGGGGGAGKFILIGILAVAVVVGIVLLAKDSGSDDAGDDGGTTGASSYSY